MHEQQTSILVLPCTIAAAAPAAAVPHPHEDAVPHPHPHAVPQLLLLQDVENSLL